jgi:hypothetical protein
VTADAQADLALDHARPQPSPQGRPVAAWWLRWLPVAAAFTVVSAILVVADTSPVDIAKYTAYIVLTLTLPGTLVFRALRRAPHTLVEDLAMGTAVGLTLELLAWAVFSVLDLRAVVWLWPLLVVVPFMAVPRLRRHWRVNGYTTVPMAWSWALAGLAMVAATYLYFDFFAQNPIIPDQSDSR